MCNFSTLIHIVAETHYRSWGSGDLHSVLSAEFRSFLPIMCIDALESATNSLSTGLILDGEGRQHFSVGEKNVVH